MFLFFPGLQDVLPEFLRGRFVEAALSYVACNSEGELLCRNNDCWCRCSPRFPECNCPFADIKVMEENLEKSKDAWNSFNQEFMESGMSCNNLHGCNEVEKRLMMGFGCSVDVSVMRFVHSDLGPELHLAFNPFAV